MNMQKPRMSARVYAYLALWILQWLAVAQAALAATNGFYVIGLTRSMADDNLTIIQSKLIPYIKAHPQHYQLSDIANMEVVTSQATSEMLGTAESLFIQSATFLAAFALLWLILYRFFPD